MSNVARDRYLEGRTLGASGPRLRSMLVDRAWQLCRATSQAIRESRFEDVQTDAAKLRAVLRELFVTIDPAASETSRQVRSLYEYIYRASLTAVLRCSLTDLAAIEELLKFEAETWRQVAAKHESREGATVASHAGPFSASA